MNGWPTGHGLAFPRWALMTRERTAPDVAVDERLGSGVEILLENLLPVPAVLFHLFVEKVNICYRVSVCFVSKL